jgi:putative transposase
MFGVMAMILNYKYEIFPTQEQLEKLNSWINICRQTYNSALLDKSNRYQKSKKSLTRQELQRIQTADKKVYSFLKEVPSQPLQEVFVRLEKSFDKFFRKEANYPKIKKHKDHSSITFTQFGVFQQKLKSGKLSLSRRAASLGKGGKLQISKLGLIDIAWHRKLGGKVKQVVIKRQGSRWYAIFSCVERHVSNDTPDYDNTIGIDVGIKKFAVLSDGTEIEKPRFLILAEKKLKKAQRKLSKMQKGSNNWFKQLMVVRKIHTKVVNQRRDFLHKWSFRLANTYSIISVEDLNIQNMLKNRKLAKYIQDAGWGMFTNYLDYKCEKNGGLLIRVKPNFTSQDCSNCGARVKKSLSVRTHICTKCGTILCRDENAAKNIEAKGLATLIPLAS